MKITLVAASSIDGKITHGNDPDVRAWTSVEDSMHFAQMKDEHDLLVMGRRTYEVIRSWITLSPRILRVVLTKHPNDFSDEVVKGQLEFSSESPPELVRRLEKKGYSKMLVVGGGQIHSLFFIENLVDEIYLTIEPRLFGNGTDLVAKAQLDIELELISVRRLNDPGTLLLRYKVQKDQP